MIAVVRNEVDPDCAYHCDALASYFPDGPEINFVRSERPELEEVDGVVLTGSTAGVYEADDRPWIEEQEAFVRELIEREVPTLGVCFGHQVVNAALGGTVEHVGMRSQLVEVEFADDPLFEGVSPVVPVVHGDVVSESGDDLEVIASADYYHAFGTRHRDAPLWTVQFHPEFTPDLRDRIDEDFGWTETELSYDDVNAPRIFENFERLVAASTAD